MVMVQRLAMKQRRSERGFLLVEVLIILGIAAAVATVAVPQTLTFYRRAAIEYEANKLLQDLRYVQALSRTTVGNISTYGMSVDGSREPRLTLRATSYEIADSRARTLASHKLLPAIIVKKRGDGESGIGGAVIGFDANGGLNSTANMTLVVYAKGYESEGQRIVIDNAARIRLER